MFNNELIEPIVSCDWLFSNLKKKQLIILNASATQNDYDQYEVIPGSRYIDLKGKFCDRNARFPNTIPSKEQFESEARSLGINQNSIIIVYDDKGLYWSPRVWWLFKTFGFENIAVLDGGLPEWKRKNFETDKPSNVKEWEKGNLVLNYKSSKMLFFEDIQNLLHSDSHKIFDARSIERFQCLSPEPRKSLRIGTIPNSVNLPYNQVLNGNCLKSSKELKAIFNTFTITDENLIFSCGSGITACILALAAETINYKNTAVYDGSWTEYGTLTD